MLSKTELLLIRACKVQNHEQRLAKVFKRQYLNPALHDRVQILLNIVSNHNLISVKDITAKIFNPFYPISDYSKLYLSLVSIIANTDFTKHLGYISPIRFRKDINLIQHFFNNIDTVIQNNYCLYNNIHITNVVLITKSCVSGGISDNTITFYNGYANPIYTVGFNTIDDYIKVCKKITVLSKQH